MLDSSRSALQLLQSQNKPPGNIDKSRNDTAVIPTNTAVPINSTDTADKYWKKIHMKRDRQKKIKDKEIQMKQAKQLGYDINMAALSSDDEQIDKRKKVLRDQEIGNASNPGYRKGESPMFEQT